MYSIALGGQNNGLISACSPVRINITDDKSVALKFDSARDAIGFVKSGCVSKWCENNEQIQIIKVS
jgi:hypothetical protein